MSDFNYSSPGFLSWWTSVWLSYVLGQGAAADGVDGVRIDCAVEEWYASGAGDVVARSARDGGHEIAIWGESARYHFCQHDFVAPIANLSAAVASAAAAGYCLNTLQFSCHDSGWESGPGNYFFLRGSRVQFAHGALSPFIPLWLGGDEYDESPITDLPSLKKDLYGTSGLPGGWMYGSVRDWSQLYNPHGRQRLMLADTTALLAIVAAHGDVLHRDACASHMASLAANVSSAVLELEPYFRWLPGREAVLVLSSLDLTSPADVRVAVPLAQLGMSASAFFDVALLYGGDATPRRLPASALSSLALTIAADCSSGGGVAVLLIEPSQ